MSKGKREDEYSEQSLGRRLIRAGCGIGILIVLAPVLLAWALR